MVILTRRFDKSKNKRLTISYIEKLLGHEAKNMCVYKDFEKI